MGALNVQLASHGISHKGERTQISGPSGPVAFAGHSWAGRGPLSSDFSGPSRTQFLLKPIGLPAARAAGAIDLLSRRGVGSKEARSKPPWPLLLGSRIKNERKTAAPAIEWPTKDEVTSP
jgi:hypothetical protein